MQWFVYIFVALAVMMFAVFLTMLFIALKGWRKNNNSPKLTVNATVVSKRAHVSCFHNDANIGMHSSTNYFVTFQFDSGDRLEMRLSGSDYGQLAEGDNGRLTFQGTRFLDFTRI